MYSDATFQSLKVVDAQLVSIWSQHTIGWGGVSKVLGKLTPMIIREN